MATAVEWLHKESNELIIKFLDNEIDMIIFIELYHNNYCKAKEMENQQRIDAYDDGKEDVFDWLKKMDYDFLVEEINKTE